LPDLAKHRNRKNPALVWNGSSLPTQITTPAGTFECTVLESIDYDEVRKKLWMINDRLGIYARIIEENPDEIFGHYSVYELQEIKTH
jgi:hypothetical protein